LEKKLLVLRSSERPSAYYPPCYARAANNKEGKRYAACIWPDEAEMRTSQKMQPENAPAPEPWAAEALQLVHELLNGRQIDQLQ
jgi:hypothetical protein